MIKNILIFAVILITIAVAYSMGKKQDTKQVNDLKTQINSMRDQLNVQGKNLESSYHRLHRSLNLHLAETSIETAINETLDQNFGQAKAAVDSAQKYLKGAQGKFIRLSDLTPITKELDSVTEKLAHLDKGAIESLNDADRQVRVLITKNSR